MYGTQDEIRHISEVFNSVCVTGQKNVFLKYVLRLYLPLDFQPFYQDLQTRAITLGCSKMTSLFVYLCSISALAICNTIM